MDDDEDGSAAIVCRQDIADGNDETFDDDEDDGDGELFDVPDPDDAGGRLDASDRVGERGRWDPSATGTIFGSVFESISVFFEPITVDLGMLLRLSCCFVGFTVELGIFLIASDGVLILI